MLLVTIKSLPFQNTSLKSLTVEFFFDFLKNYIKTHHIKNFHLTIFLSHSSICL